MSNGTIGRAWIPACVFVLAAMVLSCSRPQSGPEFDLIIANGTVVDGSGRPRFSADVAVKNDAIVYVGNLEEEEQRSGRVIDATGLTVAPGFIDTHSHSDYTLLVDGAAQSKIRQGVTSEILGESSSAGPVKGKASLDLSEYGLEVDWETLGGYFRRLEEGGVSVNVGSYVGSSQIRACVLGNEESREPTPGETNEMKRLVVEAMRDGALGLSSALTIPPQTYLSTQQLVDMASEVRPFGGIYATHTRSGGGVLLGIKEALEIGERAQIPVDFVHLNNTDRKMWGKVSLIRELVDEARARGQRVTANKYPYVAGQNNLRALIPPWGLEGSREDLLARLKDARQRERMARDIYGGIEGWFNHYLLMQGWDTVRVAVVRKERNKIYEGKSVAEIATMTSKKPTDAVFDLLLDEEGSIPAVYFMMSEEDVRETLRIPWVSIGSDGTAVRPDGILGKGKPHPRWYGAFPRVLGKYVREEKVLTLEEAVHKMTWLSAEKLGIEDRGLLAEGKKADITVFDAETVIDRATFEDPHQYPEGIEYVIVNGTVVLDQGQHTGAKPGRILYGKGKDSSPSGS